MYLQVKYKMHEIRDLNLHSANEVKLSNRHRIRQIILFYAKWKLSEDLTSRLGEFGWHTKDKTTSGGNSPVGELNRQAGR